MNLGAFPSAGAPADGGTADAAQVAAATVALMRTVLPAPARLELQMEGGSRFFVRCSGTALAQMLCDLCTIAHRGLGHRTGSITVRVAATPQGVTVSITGFRHSILAHEADTSDTEARLARICRCLATCPGGALRHTGPGQDDALVLTLPLADGEGDSAGAAAGASRPRVMVVDDEVDLIDVMTIGLRRLGCEVTGFSQPREALAAFAAAPADFDVVVTDYIMPELDGEQLCRALRAYREDLKVILCTGFSETFGRGAEPGPFHAVLDKPVDLRRVSKLIESLAGQSRQA
jgi:CheY-like chemotaxis protein